MYFGSIDRKLSNRKHSTCWATRAILVSLIARQLKFWADSHQVLASQERVFDAANKSICCEVAMTKSTSDAGQHILTTSIAEWPKAEVILLTVFRCWLAGYETSDITCWELAWQGLARTVPLTDAKRIIAELGQFARVFRATLANRFVYLPHCCGRVTVDECLALRLVACAQGGDMNCASECAYRLSQNQSHAALVGAASDLAEALRQAGLTLTTTGEEASFHSGRALH